MLLPENEQQPILLHARSDRVFRAANYMQLSDLKLPELKFPQPNSWQIRSQVYTRGLIAKEHRHIDEPI